MKVTAKTIAEQLNISPATVDRVLHNRGNVSPKTAKRVLEKAKELNYTPNKSASFLSKKKNSKVAFVFPEYPQYFWKQIECGIRSTLEDLRDFGFHIEIFKIPHEVEKQMKVVQDIINSNAFNGLVICPTDGNPLRNIIKQGIDQGFPIFTFNNDSPSSDRLSYVGADYYESGRLAGELLNKFTNQSKKVAMIIDEMDTFQMLEKRRGFETYATACTQLELVKVLKLDNENVMDSLNNMQADFIDVDGIYVACGALADVAEQMSRLHLHHRPILIGHDMSKSIYQHLQEDVVTATICQDPIFQGSLAVRLAFNYIMLEKEVEKSEHIVKLEIVTKGNAKYFLH